MGQSTWTEEMDATLREKASSMPYADIGKLLGVSKGAVSGRAARLGISTPTGARNERKLSPEEALRRRLAQRRRDAEKKRAKRRAESLGLHRIPRALPQRVEKTADVVPLHVAFENLAAGQCRYPYGDELPFTFCGCAAVDGSSYCLPHKTLAYSTTRMTAEEFIQNRRAFRAQLLAEAV